LSENPERISGLLHRIYPRLNAAHGSQLFRWFVSLRSISPSIAGLIMIFFQELDFSDSETGITSIFSCLTRSALNVLAHWFIDGHIAAFGALIQIRDSHESVQMSG
jgi:hypothetical protein